MNGNYYSNESAKASAAVSSEGKGSSLPKPKPKAITKVKAVKEPSTTKKSKTKADITEVVWTGKGSNNSTAHSAVPSSSSSSSSSSTTSSTTSTSSDSSLPKAANKKLTTGWIEYCNAERERVVKEAGIGAKVKKPTVGTRTPCVPIT